MVKHRSGTRWLDNWEVRWHCMWSAPCIRKWWVWVSWFSLKTKVDGFSQFVLKTNGYSFLVWSSKPRSMVWWFGSQNHHDGFLVWTSKPSKRRFVSLCFKTNERIKTVWGHALTSGGVTKQVGLGFPNFASKLAEERWWVVHVASLQRSCGSEAKYGWFDGVGCGTVEVGPSYPSLDVIFLLAHRTF
jgi:hypothetical protein